MALGDEPPSSEDGGLGLAIGMGLPLVRLPAGRVHGGTVTSTWAGVGWATLASGLVPAGGGSNVSANLFMRVLGLGWGVFVCVGAAVRV